VKCFRPNPDFEWRARKCARTAVPLGFVACLLAALVAGAHAQAPAPGSAPNAVVKSFRIIQEKDGPAVEILSTRPLIPSIRELSDPARLVIDLPNARLESRVKRISVQADQISTLRADQFQENPAVARIVVDLLVARSYTWAAAGNRLVVHLGKTPPEKPKTPFQPPSVASLTPAPMPVAAVARPTGPLAVAGNTLAAGSSISAGADTAVLNLARGGEVHVCPGTTVSVTPSQSGHNVMLGVNTGALEAHYRLDASSDTVMTPDFRILLTGPGEFHFAISSDSQGNTCVRSLPGNTASAVVTELIGDRSYQVKATDQLVFHSGQLDRVDMAVPLECGCPPPRQNVLRAQSSAVSSSDAGTTQVASAAPATSDSPSRDAAAPAPIREANELHVKVEAPFVFRATGPPPAPVEEVRALPLDARAMPVPVPNALPPEPVRMADAAPRRGFFGKLRGFFAAMFR